MQAGSVYDQVGEYRMLTLEGTDETTLDKARMMEVKARHRSCTFAAARHTVAAVR